MLLVPETSEFETLADLIAYAKENPGRVTVANSGALGGDYMMTLMLEDAGPLDGEGTRTGFRIPGMVRLKADTTIGCSGGDDLAVLDSVLEEG